MARYLWILTQSLIVAATGVSLGNARPWSIVLLPDKRQQYAWETRRKCINFNIQRLQVGVTHSAPIGLI